MCTFSTMALHLYVGSNGRRPHRSHDDVPRRNKGTKPPSNRHQTTRPIYRAVFANICWIAASAGWRGALELSLLDGGAARLMDMLVHVVQHNDAALVALHGGHGGRALGLGVLLTLPKHQQFVLVLLVVAVLVDQQHLLAVRHAPKFDLSVGFGLDAFGARKQMGVGWGVKKNWKRKRKCYISENIRQTCSHRRK